MPDALAHPRVSVLFNWSRVSYVRCGLEGRHRRLRRAALMHGFIASRRGRPSVAMNERSSGSTAGIVGLVQELSAGPLFKFADWPDDQVPRRAAGVYTVWRAGEFLYVGMSGRGAQREDFVVDSSLRSPAKGLWTRLNSHASGRRSGDQFNLYICDRFIVPALTADQRRAIGQGLLLLDQLTKSFIRGHLGYRFTVYGDGAEALAVERAVRGGALHAGRPYLNPL